MDDRDGGTAHRPLQLLVVLRRRAWILLACIIIAGVAAYLDARHDHKRYSATASLLFQQSEISEELFGFSPSVAQDPTTQQATDLTLASEPILALDTAHAVGHGFTYKSVKGAISVTAAGAGNVVNVTATTTSPALSAALANAYAQEVLNYERLAQRAQVQQAATQLQTQISQLPTGSIEAPALKTRLSQLQVLTSLVTGNVQLAGQALRPTGASSPSVKRDIALGVIAGFLVGLLAALLAERLDATLHDADETKELLQWPVLGTIPAIRSRTVSTGVPPPALAESFRLLRVQLHYFNVDREIKSLLIASASTGDGKSTVAWHLACTAAELAPHSSVLLIDADLRRPRIAELSGEPRLPGLAEALTQRVAHDAVVRTHLLPHNNLSSRPAQLSIITSGAVVPNPVELLESKAFERLLKDAQRDYDLVIVDSPPTSVVSDAIPLIRQVSGIVAVVRVGHTRRDAARALQEQLVQLHAPILGMVINDVHGGRHRYRQYAGYYAPPAARSADLR
jgi:capsular exopolysaccharide synthesis family protein